MSKYLTIAELAEQADIPNSTCRRYLTSFESFFLVKGGSRLKKYEASAVDVLKRIKQLYEEGQDTNEIHNSLVNDFPLVVNGDEQEKNEQAATVPGLATSEDIAEIKKALDEQKQFNQTLLEKLEEQHLYYEKKFEELKHDREFVSSLKNSMEQRKIESAEHQNKTDEQLGNINHQLSEIQQTIKEAAVTNEEVVTGEEQLEKKGFFKRLFGK
jgi:DNA-dependent RNA polymerase auxiliary subunit epsilon